MRTPHPSSWRLTALLSGLLAAGACLTWWTVAQADRRLHANLLVQARLVAQAVDLRLVQALTGSGADLASPGYQQLKSQLMSIRSAHLECRWFYLMGRRADGTVFFLVDSEVTSSAGYSPPGQVYAEVPAAYRRVFDAGTATVAGPVADRWGTWVSALVPLIDPGTGTVPAVLGLDVDARIWRWGVAAEAALPAGLTLVLFISAITALAAIRRRTYLPKPILRRLLPPLAAMVVLLLAGTAALLWYQQQRQVAEEVAADVSDAAGDLRAALEQQTDVLIACAKPIAADPAVRKALRESDADRLLAAGQPVFDALGRESHLTNLSFLDARRVCLLRLHQPDQRGDRVDRFTARTAERTGKTASGIELGTLGAFVLRVVQPVFDGTTLAGYVELGVALENAVKALHTRSGNQLAVVIRKARLNREVWAASMRRIGREADWDRLPRSVVAFASQGRLPDAFVPFVDRVASAVDATDEAACEITVNGRDWRFSSTPLQDASGAVVGDLVVMRDITFGKAAFARYMTLGGAAAAVLFALLLSAIYVLLRRTDAGIAAQQAQLGASEQKYRHLVDHANSVILRWTRDGNITFLNEFGLRFFGYAETEILGRHVVGTIVPETESTGRDLAPLIGQICANPKSFENNVNENMRRNGERVWIAWTNHVDFDEQGRVAGILSVGTDITERHHAQEELRRTNALLSTQQDVAIDGILAVDGDGRILSWNRRFTEMWGIPPTLRVGQDDAPVLDLVVNQLADPPAFVRRVEYLYGHRQESGRDELLLADGRTFDRYSAPMSGPGGEYYGRVWYFSDISERKRTEQQVRALLAESNQTREALLGILEDQTRAEAGLKRLATAIEQATEMVLITDPAGAIQYVNPAFETTTGYTGAEAIGQNPRLLKSGQQDAAFYRQLWETISAGRVWQGHLVNRKKDGTLYTEETVISPVRDTAGAIINYVAVKRDITQELDLQVQLAQAQKMDAVGQLAGGVAHDFNNKLQTILGTTELLLAATEPDDPRTADLNDVMIAARGSAELTRQLLAFARKQTIAPVVLNLNDTVATLLRMLRRLIGENIDLLWRPAADLWPVKMDPTQVDQILANLTVNARDAITGVGKLSMATGKAELDAAYCQTHPDATPGAYVMLAVSDDGCGMDAATLARIFEPFFTTKPIGQGTGLGLATVYGIVKQNNGFIEVASEPGRGTTFRIYLPRHAATATEAAAAAAPPAVLATGTETVLLVEDEAPLLRLARRLLEALGYTVLAADGPREALRLAAEFTGEIHLLLTDVVMPDLSGRDLRDRLSTTRPGMKCLFMSGYTADAIAHRGVLDAGLHFIQKPFSQAAVAAKLREVLAGSVASNQ